MAENLLPRIERLERKLAKIEAWIFDEPEPSPPYNDWHNDGHLTFAERIADL